MKNKDIKSLELDKVLSSLASFCCCEDAVERAKNLSPSSDEKEVKTRLDETAEAHSLLARFGGPSFGGLHNTDDSLTRANAGSVLTAGELLRIASNLSVFNSVLAYRTNFSGVKTCLDKYFDGITQNKYLEDKIKTAIISEEEISDRASANLANIRRRIALTENKLRDSLQKMIRSQSGKKYLQESIVTIREGRFVIPVKAEHQKDVPGLVHDISQSGSTVFIEPTAVVDANNELRILKSKEKDEIEHILYELSGEAGGFCDTIKQSYDTALSLHLIFAKANFGYSIKASVPQVNSNGYVYLKNARHPLLPKDTAVPITITVGKEFDSLVITGPNTGGKTVSLKTLGLINLMAMCGLMIPADDESEISVFDNILCDIGDEQSIEQSLSTFSAHITNIKRIFSLAGKKSLILLDELGAGTDPVEGAALAESILEELRSMGAKIAATTHYAELKAYALRTKRVVNASCEFDVETLRPTYRLIIGTIGRSNAFAISRRIGISDKVIDRANELISSSDREFEDVVKRLEETRAKLEKSQQESERIRVEAENNLRRANEQTKRLEKEKAREIAKAEERARAIVEETRARSNELLNALEDMKKEYSENHSSDLIMRARQSVKSGINKLEDTASPVMQKDNGGYTLPRALKVGDSVLIVDLDKQGTVTAYKQGENFATVQAGIFNTKVALSNIRLIEKKSQPTVKSKTFKATVGNDMRSQSLECDIRGMDTVEGIDTLDKFIDDAILSHLSSVTVIHGKGTGALRSAVHAYLRKNKQVRTFRLGVYGEGEDGVTIIELK